MAIFNDARDHSVSSVSENIKNNLLADNCEIWVGPVNGMFKLEMDMTYGATNICITLSDKLPKSVLSTLEHGLCDDNIGQAYGFLILKKIRVIEYINAKFTINHGCDYTPEMKFEEVVDTMRRRIQMLIDHVLVIDDMVNRSTVIVPMN